MKYLVNGNGNGQVYFYKTYEGICALNMKPGNGERERVICSKGTESFFVYKSDDGATHLITASADSRLIYMLCRNNEWHSYDIGGINGDIKIKKMMIGANKLGQSLFYSALYHGEYILVHCILGDNAMPATIDKLQGENFFIYKMRVYYTNENGIMGYQSFSDGRPVQFVYCGEGIMPYVCSINGKTMLAYKKEKELCVNGRMYAADIDSELPVICKSGERTMLVWKSGDYIRAVPCDDSEMNGTVQSSAYGIRPELFIMSDGICCSCFYGVLSGGRLRMFYAGNPFAESEERSAERKLLRLSEETEQLKQTVEQLEKEAAMYKTEIMRLNEILKSKCSSEE